MSISLLESLSYEPVASKFGTSGVRALVSDLTDLEVYCLTRGTLNYLQRIGRVYSTADQSISIPVGGDLRPSTDRLIRATTRAIQDAGYAVDYIGKLPTPALTVYALERGVCSFMVTGSHIPVDRNGQKANRCDGELLKSDEPGVVAAVEEVRQQQYQQPADESIFDSAGMLLPQHVPDPVEMNPAATANYLRRYQALFSSTDLEGLRLVFFQYAAVGRDLLPQILQNAGAEVIAAGRSDVFEAIDTEAISEEHLHRLLRIILQARASHGRIDALISSDGDSDRPLVISVEEKTLKERLRDVVPALRDAFADLTGGMDAVRIRRRLDLAASAVRVRFIPGDLLGTLVADVLGADSVSIPISANPAVHEFFAQKGITTRKTRIGSPFVIEAMREATASGCSRVVSWEANGGFLVGSDLEWNGNKLPALPTRDAILPILCVLYAARKHQCSLSQLLDQLPRWFGRADLIDNFERERSAKVVDYFRLPDENSVWIRFGDHAVELLDSQEQVTRTLDTADSLGEDLSRRKQRLESHFSARKGFGTIRRINCQDGVRCFFDNDEIAHIRPSGNAPQLRIYAQARTQERADRIVALGIADDGILQELAAELAANQ